MRMKVRVRVRVRRGKKERALRLCSGTLKQSEKENEEGAKWCVGDWVKEGFCAALESERRQRSDW